MDTDNSAMMARGKEGGGWVEMGKMRKMGTSIIM